MSEGQQGMTDEEAAVELARIMDHPWVAPVMNDLNPSPVPTSFNIEPVELEFPDQTVDSALMTIVTPSGLTTVYISPNMLQQIVITGAGILQNWADEAQKKPGLVVANKAMEKEARKMHDAAQTIKEN